MAGPRGRADPCRPPAPSPGPPRSGRAGRRRTGPEAGDEVRADQGAEVVVPTDQRHLRDHRLDPTVDRPDHEHVATGVAAPPHADPVAIDLRQGGRVGDRVAIVPHLRPRVDLLARLAVAGAEVAVVEHQGVEPGRGERLGVLVEVHLLHGREAVRHDDRRRRAGRTVCGVEPSAQDDAFGVELDVASSHCGLPVRSSEPTREASAQPRAAVTPVSRRPDFAS